MSAISQTGTYSTAQMIKLAENIEKCSRNPCLCRTISFKFQLVLLHYVFQHTTTYSNTPHPTVTLPPPCPHPALHLPSIMDNLKANLTRSVISNEFLETFYA